MGVEARAPEVSEDQVPLLRAEERARVVAARPEGTTRAYGDADCTKGCTAAGATGDRPGARRTAAELGGPARTARRA
mgnify:CR=1 FL=1